MRVATLTVKVANRHLADRSAMPGRQSGNKAVELPVQGDLFEDLAPIGLERGAEVVDVDTAQLGHEPVGAARWNAPQPQVIDTLLAPAADDVVAFLDFLEEDRDVGRVMLQVAVHGDDVFAA